MVTTKAAAPAPAAVGSRSRSRARPPARLDTLAIDVGGTGLKAAVLSPTGELLGDRVRMATPYPLPADRLITSLAHLVEPLGPYDRISLGFPGMVRQGKVITAPHFISPSGPEGKVSPTLLKGWTGFDLASALVATLGKPTRVGNDADLQGAAVVTGHGLEVTVTLGTGVGTSVFWQGRVAPHLELAHHPLRNNQTYNEQLGEDALRRIGRKKWNRRVGIMIQTIHDLVFYDHLFIGGGNAPKVSLTLPPDVSLVDNRAGILGGIKLWERAEL